MVFICVNYMEAIMKKIAILGSTGSIGIQTLEVAREHKDEIKVVSLVAHSNIDLLEQQIREFMPELVYDENKAKQQKTLKICRLC